MFVVVELYERLSLEELPRFVKGDAPQIVVTPLADTVAYPVKDRVEAEQIIKALTHCPFWRQWVTFDYDNGMRIGCLLAKSVRRVGMATEEELQGSI